MKRRIVMFTSGTRGDVQPMVALGCGLQQAGYDVCIATHPPFATLVQTYGLRYAPIHANPNDLLSQADGHAALAVRGNPWHNIAASARFVRRAQPLYAQMLTEAWAACCHADALVVSLPTLWAQQLADALGIPCVWALTQPLTPTAQFASPLLPLRVPLGSWGNRASHRLVDASMWLPWRGVFNRWRRTVGLPPLGYGGPFAAAAERATVLYGFSERVVARPTDWPAQHRVVGYWPLDAPPDWHAPSELAAFVEAGAPVVMGFGSMGVREPDRAACLSLEALALAKQRGLLQFPPVPLKADPRRALFVSDVPHSWLFRRAAAVAHHGGAGTTAAALLAGVPSIVVPHGIDQFFWSERIVRLHVGFVLPSRNAATPRALAAAIRAATSDRSAQQRAAELGALLRAENGVAAAVAAIGELL